MATKPKGGPLTPAGPAPLRDSPHDGLLDAARQVFCEQGFSGARTSGAMRRAWAEVGCPCSSPVPVDELFLVLWNDDQAAHARASGAAVAQARRAGTTAPDRLFEVGTRAFLHSSWLRRDLALLFSSGDGPHGFADLRQRNTRTWHRRNTLLLDLGDSPQDRLYIASLTSIIGEGSHEVATAADFRQAQAMIDAVIGYWRLLAGDRPGGTAG
jgi:hypothetical protein